jgi:hypothetical protein
MSRRPAQTPRIARIITGQNDPCQSVALLIRHVLSRLDHPLRDLLAQGNGVEDVQPRFPF